MCNKLYMCVPYFQPGSVDLDPFGVIRRVINKPRSMHQQFCRLKKATVIMCVSWH